MKNRKYLVGLALAVAFILIPMFSHAQATTTITVLSPNGGEFWPLVGSQTIRWSAPSLPTSTTMQIELIPVAGATVQCPNYAYTTSLPGILNTGQYTIPVNVPSFCRGQYVARVGAWQSGFISDTSDLSFTISETPAIAITSPNGGEVWQLARTHSILWSPYNPGLVYNGTNYVYHPELAINPASTTVAYLQQLVNGNFVTVGKIVESGKASIYWDGYLVGEFQEPTPHPLYPDAYIYNDPPPFLATPGQYYVKIVNKITGAWDRSDQPFTLAPENSVWADLKINGVDVNGYSSTIVPTGQADTDYQASWTSNSSEKCTLTYQFFSRAYNGLPFDQSEIVYGVTENLPANSSMVVRVFPLSNTQPGSVGWIYVNCPTSMSGSGIEGIGYETNTLYYEYVTSVSSANGSNFVKVTAPNNGVGISWSNPYQITWEVSADVENVSIALYKNSAFYKWIARDLPAQIKNYRWTPSMTILSSELGANYQISLIGRKQIPTGVIIQDKSDKPFSLVSSIPRGGGTGGPYQNQIDNGRDLTANALSALSTALRNLQKVLLLRFR